AAFHAGLEPLDALRGRSVRESVRHHPPGGHPLQTVVADRGGRAQRLLSVTGLELDAAGLKASLLRRGVAPHAGEAVRLEFEGDRGAVRAAARAAHTIRVAEQVLDVMTDLVRDHVRLREVTRRAEALRQLAEEA